MGLLTQDPPIPSSVVTEDSATQLSFIQKVYSLFLLGLFTAFAGAFVTLSNRDFAMAVLSHVWIGLIIYFGVFFACMALRKTPGVNVLALLAFTFVSGVFLTPALLTAAMSAGGSFNVVYEAALITGSIFIGLTLYTFVTKKDFSFLGGFITVGLFAVIGVGLVLMFVHSEAANLALAWISSVLFSLFILFDTSRVMRAHESDEYVSAALSLYLDFINLFLAILRILSNRRN
ncbi:MAG TPA: Bax inhibitor-1 family protein [bacterium]|nr:Bax inhibitor-1 family protein [bacterium]